MVWLTAVRPGPCALEPAPAGFLWRMEQLVSTPPARSDLAGTPGHDTDERPSPTPRAPPPTPLGLQGKPRIAGTATLRERSLRGDRRLGRAAWLRPALDREAAGRVGR